VHEVRARKTAPVSVDPPAVEEIVDAEGTRVPVRIFFATAAQPRGVCLDVHGRDAGTE
jgi:acetyl esterase